MRAVLRPLLVIGLWMGGIAQGADSLSDEIETGLKTESYIYVATQRLNGQWGTSAPVWFMYEEEEGTVYFTVAPTSHKALRIHRGSPVRVWVGTEDGPFFEGHAQFIRRNPALVERMAEVYKQKYWLAWLGFARPRPARVGSGKTLVVKVTPMTQEPGKSHPAAPSQ
ncbi:MAG: hypothetical protein ACREQ3_26620 [Candidatus Binatia bacterium]